MSPKIPQIPPWWSDSDETAAVASAPLDELGPERLVIGWAPGSEPIRDLLTRISTGEGTSDTAAQAYGYPSGSGYDVAFGGMPTSKPISRMTLGEIKEFQRQRGTGKNAVGKYQMLQGTLDDLRKYFNLDGSEMFSPDLQDRMARHLLERRRFNDYVAGKISAPQLQRNLTAEWDSIAVPGTGLTRNHHVPGTTSAQIQDAISQIQRAK